MKKLIMLMLCMVAVGCASRKPITIYLPKSEPFARVEQKQETRQEVIDTKYEDIEIYVDPDNCPPKYLGKIAWEPTIVKTVNDVPVIMGTAQNEEVKVKTKYPTWFYVCVGIAILIMCMLMVSLVFLS